MLRAWLGIGVAFLLATGATAADWPTKPVRIVYNYPPGTSGDVLTRAVADALSQRLGQPFVVDNRAGAAGTVGTEAASRATPDGYTFLASPNSPMVLLPQLRKVGYVPRDFKPIAALGEYVYGWAVLPSLGVKTVAELVAMAKAKPGVLTYSTPGVGSATNLRGEAFNILAGTQITQVPYRAGSEAIIDFLGGRLDVMLDSLHFPYVRQGKAVMLAVTANRRHPEFPEVPTMAEAGYPIDLPTWLALYAIKGTPDDIARRLGDAVREITSKPEFKERTYTLGFFPMDQDASELAAMNEREFGSYEAWVKRANFKIE